jgi:hypothetical protein
MKITYSSLVNAALTAVLVTSLLFMATGTTTSRVDNKVVGGAVYNPWFDTDDNGIINMLDLYNVALIYGTAGTPINKTALVTDLENRIAALEAKFPLNNTNLAAEAIPYVYSQQTTGPSAVDTGWLNMLYHEGGGVYLTLNRTSHLIIIITAQFKTASSVETQVYTSPGLQALPGPMTVLTSSAPPADTGWQLITIVYTAEAPVGFYFIAPQTRSGSGWSYLWFNSVTIYALPA